MIRLSNVPLSYIISYVRHMEDMSSTLLPAMTLSRADRTIVDLDAVKSEDFWQLAEGVASVRAWHCLGRDDLSFDAHTTLGRISINRLLQKQLEHATSQKARDLLDKAVALREAGNRQGGPLPIYQAFIIVQPAGAAQLCGSRSNWAKLEI